MFSKSSDIVLNVFIPHLFDALEEWHTNFSFVPETKGLVPLLSQFTERKSALSGFIPSLYRTVGFNKWNGFPPHAISCYHYDFGVLPTKAVLLATPIHLQTGMTDVTVDGLAVTDISSIEAESLQIVVNQHFKADDLRLEISPSGRWYVLLPFSLMPETTYPADEVLGNSLFPFLHHTKQLEWNRLLNELQMLLYTSVINQQRERQGLRSVSSFWLWGNAQHNKYDKVEKMVKHTHSLPSVVAGGFNGKAFAHLLQTEWYKRLPNTIDGDTVVIIDDLLKPSLCNDIDRWQQALTRVEADYIKPLFKMYRANTNIELIIHTCDGRQWVKRPWYQRLRMKKKASLVDYC